MKNQGLLLVLLVIAIGINAQEGKNIVKLNLPSVALNTYALQYERVINNKQSIALGIAVSPNTDLPFKKRLMDAFGGNADVRNAIQTTRFTKLTITPEYRFYLSKKEAPGGFYIAPFARYTHLNIDQDYRYTPASGIEHVANLRGHFNGIGGGAMIGMQWMLGKRVTLDWWILGPFIGDLDAEFNGTDDMSDLSAQDKANLERDIEDVDIPLWTIDATIGNNIVTAKIKGPFYGVRAFGVSIGIRF